MRTTITRITCIALIIWTAIVLYIVYKNVEFPFILQFVVSYLVFGFIAVLYLIISVFLNMRKLKCSTIRKMMLKLIIRAFGIWAFTVLFIYLIKGELRITDKIFSSIAVSFALTYGELLHRINNTKEDL